MGAEQTLTSRNSQENVTSNNALSINDSSSHGLSLQRKANVANNTGVMQRMAWVATKEMDDISSNDGGEGRRTGALNADVALDKVVDENGKRKRLDYNWWDLYRHHRCFVFSPLNGTAEQANADENAVMDRIAILRGYDRTGDNSMDNNIGYGIDELTGNATLYSDDISNRGYTLQEKISDNPTDDFKLVESMSKKEFRPETSDTYNSYSALTTNCQDWVEDVRDDAGV